jgi:hypothetical protein
LKTDNDQILFEEKQYLGYNKFSVLWRTLLALFCFIAYYWSENPKPVDVSGIRIGPYPADTNSGSLLFLMGIVILIISALLVFVLHIHTRVTPLGIEIKGLWTSRVINIPMTDIVSVKKSRYKRAFLNRPVYNLHYEGKIRFYTRGNELLEVTTKGGTVYKLGSQRADELKNLLSKQLGA